MVVPQKQKFLMHDGKAAPASLDRSQIILSPIQSPSTDQLPPGTTDKMNSYTPRCGGTHTMHKNCNLVHKILKHQ